MKKFLSIFAAVAMVFAMASCEEPVEEPNNNGGGNNTEQPGGNEGGGNTEQPGGNEGGGNTEQPGGNEGGGTTNPYACLNGSDYYVIVLGETYYQQIASKVKADCRPNDVDKHLYVWADGRCYTGVSCSGPNVFGDIEDWTCMITGNEGWTGMGYFVPSSYLQALTDITLNPSEYVLHLAMKSQDEAVHEFVFYSFIGDTGYKVQVGDENSTYGFKRDGEWYEIEIPMTAWTNQGLLWNPSNYPADGGNVLGILSGAAAGKYLNLDACFIYKPAK